MKEYQSIGRKVTLKYCSLGLVGIAFVAILRVVYLFFFEDKPISIVRSIADANENAVFLLSSVLAVCLAIFYFGGRAGVSIIANNRSPFWISFRTLLTTWLSLLIACGIFAGLENSIEYGWQGFYGAFLMWLGYGFFIFLILGTIHALISSRLMGREIVRRGKTKTQHGL